MPQVPLQIQGARAGRAQSPVPPRAGQGTSGPDASPTGPAARVIYGHNQPAESFKTDAHGLERILSKGGQNAIILVEHGGPDPDKASEQALIRDIQYHKVRGDVLHLDLLRIDPSETLRANVPLLTEGVPEGVRNEGGALQQTLTSIEMECVVSEMPAAMVIDISSLVIGDSLHVSDLLEQERRITTDPSRTIVNILAPRLVAAEEEAEEAEVPEGEEEAGEGGEGGEE